jgi:hypothetical protein
LLSDASNSNTNPSLPPATAVGGTNVSHAYVS